jgi:hypothetical protein
VRVADELPGLTPRSTKAQAIDDVVESELEQRQQILARDALFATGDLVVVRKLLLENLVVAARLLLLAQLQQVLGLLDTTAAMLAWGIRPALDGALVGETPLALEEQLLGLAAALLALCCCISRHVDLPRPGDACADGTRCAAPALRP